MLSKFTPVKIIACLTRSTPSCFFSDKKIQKKDDYSDSDQEDNLKNTPREGGRNLIADQENPQLNKRKIEISYAKLIWRIAVWTSFGLFCYNFYLLKYTQDPENQIGHLEPFMMAAKSVDNKYKEFYKFLTKPVMDKLLPDLPNIPGMPMELPKTLVLNLSGTLIHCDYVFGKGAEIIKRPGLNLFLSKLAQIYEVVLFSDDETMFTFNIAEKLDPQQMIFAGRLARESTVFEKGEYVKDLKYLNRDLKKVIVLEKDPKKVRYQTENAIFLKEFKGDVDDRSLYELLPLLEHLSRPEIRDIRNELKKYGNVEPARKYLEEVEMKKKQLMSQKKNLPGFFQNNSGSNSRFRGSFSNSGNNFN